MNVYINIKRVITFYMVNNKSYKTYSEIHIIALC